MRPLEKLGFVETQKSERDARLALAVLTPEGRELVDDASGVLDDVARDLQAGAPATAKAENLNAASLLLSIT